MIETNDNRMGWIRNLEALRAGRHPYTVEYELGSDCRIIGLLGYDEGRTICAPLSLEQSKSGSFLYNLIMQYFKDGIFGEIVALMSIYFRCRFYRTPRFCRPGLARTSSYQDS
jgi:hypothetical protein